MGTGDTIPSSVASFDLQQQPQIPVSQLPLLVTTTEPPMTVIVAAPVPSVPLTEPTHQPAALFVSIEFTRDRRGYATQSV